MAAQSPQPAGVFSPDRAPLGRLILIPLSCLVLLQALFAWFDFVPVFQGGLADTDAYVHMVRALDLHATGDWFDARLSRVNPPEGHVQHWTRPLDVVLVAGATLLEPLLGFRTALHLWGAILSPLLLALTFVALDWATRPMLDRDARLFACLAFLMQPTIQAYTIVGRPDHHSALLALFVVQLGLTLRLLLLPERRTALAAGVVAALAFWISAEAVLAIALSLGMIGIYWLAGDHRMGRISRDYVVAATVCLALALAIERGPDLLVIENDRLSLLHVAVFGSVAAFWVIVALAERRPVWGGRVALAQRSEPPRSPRAIELPADRGIPGVLQRSLAALVGVGVITLCLLALFPQILQGPLGPVDPLYAELRLRRIVEFQPLVPPAWLQNGQFAEIAQRATRIMGIALIALPYLLVMVRRPGTERRAWLAILLFLVVFLPLALQQVRFSTYAQALLVIPYAALIGALLRAIAERRHQLRQLARPLVVVIGLFWPLSVSDALPEGSIATAGRACPIDRVAPALEALAAGSAKTVLTYTDYTPALLYRTPLQVLSIPNHRPQPGFAATYRVLTARDDGIARAAAAEHGVDWILLCPSPAEQRLFAVAGAAPATLYRRLVDGRPPAWLRPLPLPAEFAEAVRLFEVVEPPLVAHGPDARPTPD